MFATMKFSSVAFLISLHLFGVESRTWKSHSLPSTGWQSSKVLALPLRGGDQKHDDIPQVPTYTTQQTLARGGSTTTETYAAGVTVTKPSDALQVTGGLSSENITEVTEVSEISLSQPKKGKRLKRHKLIARRLKNRNATNIKRKIMHTMFGFFFAGLNHFVPRKIFLPFVGFWTGFSLTVELLRYRKGFEWMNDLMHFVLGSTLRRNEMDGKFTGSFYYFLGVTTTTYLFPKGCTTLGICQLAVADPAASFFGTLTKHVYWSRIENGLGGLGRNKGILGFLGGALACVPMNYHLLSLAKFGTQVSRESLLAASFALGLAGAFADLAVPTPTLTLPKKVFGIRVPPFHVDDNFVVPIFSGFACKKLFEYMGWSADLELGKYLVL